MKDNLLKKAEEALEALVLNEQPVVELQENQYYNISSTVVLKTVDVNIEDLQPILDNNLGNLEDEIIKRLMLILTSLKNKSIILHKTESNDMRIYPNDVDEEEFELITYWKFEYIK